MAFIYCDACEWHQDDFWNWRYNPARCVLRYFRDYGRPRMINFDPKPHSYGRVFSWYVLFDQIRRKLRQVRRMHWWTARSFERAQTHWPGEQYKRWPVCPKCGANKLHAD